jgi:hypothetical protein
MDPGTGSVGGLSVSSRSERGCVIAALSGELDIACAPALREKLLGSLRPAASRLVIDLSRVSYADASARLGAPVTWEAAASRRFPGSASDSANEKPAKRDQRNAIHGYRPSLAAAWRQKPTFLACCAKAAPTPSSWT